MRRLAGGLERSGDADCAFEQSTADPPPKGRRGRRTADCDAFTPTGCALTAGVHRSHSSARATRGCISRTGGTMPRYPKDSREADSWFSDEQLSKLNSCKTPWTNRSPLHPSPRSMVSNGEYNAGAPDPAAETGRGQAEGSWPIPASKKLGMTRRTFLHTSGGHGRVVPGDERRLRKVLRGGPGGDVRTGGVARERPSQGPVRLRRSAPPSSAPARGAPAAASATWREGDHQQQLARPAGRAGRDLNTALEPGRGGRPPESSARAGTSSPTSSSGSHLDSQVHGRPGRPTTTAPRSPTAAAAHAPRRTSSSPRPQKA